MHEWPRTVGALHARQDLDDPLGADRTGGIDGLKLAGVLVNDGQAGRGRLISQRLPGSPLAETRSRPRISPGGTNKGEACTPVERVVALAN